MNNKNNHTENLPDILNASDLQKYLRISRAGVYNMMNADDFPTIQLGGRKLVTRENLFRWLDEHTNPSAFRFRPSVSVK